MELIPNKLPEGITLREKPAGEVARCKVGPMTFRIRHFDAADLGHLSVMEGKAMLGLMKMDTVIFTPLTRDAPLFSYDRIHAMGNDTLILEYYDTLLDGSLRANEAAAQYAKTLEDLPDHDLGKKWYDHLKLPGTVSKRAKKVGERFDRFYQESFAAYLTALKDAPPVDPAAKRAKTAEYVNGLFENGGPSTDQFVKALGREKTVQIFEDVIFGIGR